MLLNPATQAAITQAKRDRKHKRLITGVIVIAVLVAVIIGGTLITDFTKNATEGVEIPVSMSQINPEYSGTRSDVTVVSGNPNAKLTLDIYADFLCPSCGMFHKANSDALIRHINNGEIQVRYHMVPMLTDASDPPGYSLNAANAALCAADSGYFTAFHGSLFASQPAEGARGYDKAQLATLGTKLGAPQSFAQCVTADTYAGQLRAKLDTVKNNPLLLRETQNGKVFGVPTIIANDKMADFRDNAWIETLLATDPSR